MPETLISPLVLSEACNKDSQDLLLKQIKDTQVDYFSSKKPAKAVGFLCMLFDQSLEWVSQHGQSTFFKHPVEKLLKKVIEQIMVAVPEYYDSVLNDAAFHGAKSLASSYKAEMANFLTVNTTGKSFPYNQPKDGFHTMVAYRGSSKHSQAQDLMSKVDKTKLTFHGLQEVEKPLIKTTEMEVPVFTDPYAEGRMKILKSLGLSSAEILSSDVLMSRLVNDQSNKAKVVYMRKHERLKYLLDLGTVVKRRDPQSNFSQPLNAQLWIYAATQTGEMYAVDDKAVVQSGRTNGIELNHSSILKGRPVLCAGTVSASNGAFTTIDNASGHYAPNWKRLRDLLRILQKKNALSRDTEVYFLDKGQNSFLFIYRWKAWAFLSADFYALPRTSDQRSPAVTYESYIKDIEQWNLASYLEIDMNQLKRVAEKQKSVQARIQRF